MHLSCIQQDLTKPKKSPLCFPLSCAFTLDCSIVPRMHANNLLGNVYIYI